MSAIGTMKMTARQFLQLGEDPFGVRLELVNGEVAVSPSPLPRHGRVVMQLSTIVNAHVYANDLGEVLSDIDTIFGEHDVRRPDLLYFTKARVHLISEDAILGPPDLAVEVISPSSIRTDRKDKFEQYRKGRVKHYWIGDPEMRTLEGWTLKGGKYVPVGRGQGAAVVRFAPFPDLDIPLARLWGSK
jgi:Uma2 family endonuclease